MRPIFIFAIAVLLSTHVAWAGFEEGQDAFESGDIQLAIQEWEKAAEADDVNSLFALGLLYRYGRGVPRDSKRAAQWYQRAADAHHPVAQFNLGVMYRKGEGVPRSYREAAYLFWRAAEHGYVKAQVNLGVLYLKGLGVPHDPATAMMWFTIAANEGNARAKYNQKLLGRNMTPRQSSRARQLVDEWVAIRERQQLLQGPI